MQDRPGLPSGAFQYLAEDPGGLADQGLTRVTPPAFPEALYLIGIAPVNPGDVATQDFAVRHFVPEAPHEQVRAFPHPDIGLLAGFRTPESQTDGGQSADDNPAGFSMPVQSAPERIHGPDQILILDPQFFLPDRKNRLASMQSGPEQPGRLFLHVLRVHGRLPSRFKTLAVHARFRHAPHRGIPGAPDREPRSFRHPGAAAVSVRRTPDRRRP